ncbi:pilin [Marinomonas aquiplantarum]|uniref:Type IV pilus assembly protein PilA n=1 Tax=Marinomonas aquiplantarum TaxID=491951 RepID=A0A366CUB3_9GAMM|nr:pilin [Marinomonas aquiplantarum]RBO79658.1 type IV pilus assembly protein PilA [Marinomonas aquiplantarum]
MFIYRNVQQGFTLLELMVVIAIISILASLSAPTFTRQIAKAKLIDAQNIATQHQAIVEEFILLNGHFPSTEEFALYRRTLADNSIVKSLTVKNQNSISGDLVLTLNNSTDITEGQMITYQRDSNRNWSCTSDINEQLLPQQCTSSIGEEE